MQKAFKVAPVYGSYCNNVLANVPDELKLRSTHHFVFKNNLILYDKSLITYLPTCKRLSVGIQEEQTVIQQM